MHTQGSPCAQALGAIITAHHAPRSGQLGTHAWLAGTCCPRLCHVQPWHLYLLHNGKQQMTVWLQTLAPAPGPVGSWSAPSIWPIICCMAGDCAI